MNDPVPAEEIETGPFPEALIAGLKALAHAVVDPGNMVGVTQPWQKPSQVIATFPQAIEPFYAPLELLISAICPVAALDRPADCPSGKQPLAWRFFSTRALLLLTQQ